jgi:hypothetical protein
MFSQSMPTVLMGDFNGKQEAWNCKSHNTNGNILLDFCTDHSITITASAQYTYYPTQGQASVLDIAMTRGCVLSTPQALPFLSSDHNPVVYKIRLQPLPMTRPILYNYQLANWNMYRKVLSILLHTQPVIRGVQDLDRTIHYFTTAVRWAADMAIPKKSTGTRRPTLPPSLHLIIQIRNYIRRRYQRTRYILLGRVLHRLNTVTATALQEHHNDKWAAFLRTLHPQNAPLWRVVRYFKKGRGNIPPLLQRGTQYYAAAQKAELLAKCFEENHKLTNPPTNNAHSNAVEHLVDTYCSRQEHDASEIPPIHSGEVGERGASWLQG